MIIQIALGIVLGFIFILLLPVVLRLGILALGFALLAAAFVAVIIMGHALIDNLNTVIESVAALLAISAATVVASVLLVCLGYYLRKRGCLVVDQRPVTDWPSKASRREKLDWLMFHAGSGFGYVFACFTVFVVLCIVGAIVGILLNMPLTAVTVALIASGVLCLAPLVYPKPLADTYQRVRGRLSGLRSKRLHR